MKGVELYGQVRRAVYVEGMSRREAARPFGSPTYSFEELVAEFSAAYLCAEAGISPAVLENQAAYIQGWVAKLRSEKRMVVIAAAQAQKAADYILNRPTTGAC